MRKLLIAQHSENLVKHLSKALEDEWEIHACMDSYPVVDMLQYIRPDGFVIDLNLWPKDGFTVLDEAKPFLPQAIVVTTDIINDYIIAEAERLCVGSLVRIPFHAQHIKNCLDELYTTHYDAPMDIVKILHTLDFNPKLSGYRCLVAAIPIFASNPNLLLKEVYPTVAKLCSISDVRCVERAIRYAIHDAWIRRNPETWNYYFQTDILPSNKIFIARIAEKL